MNNFKIYLCGGMTGLTWEEQNTWRRVAKSLFEEKKVLCDLNHNPVIVNPCDYYNFNNPTAYDSDLEIMKYDLWHVKNSDLILCYFNNPKSIGSAMEIAVAYDRDIPIIGVTKQVDEINPWLSNSCNKILTDIRGAVNYITDYYLI